MGSSNIANQNLKNQVLTQNLILSRMRLFSASESQYNISKRKIIVYNISKRKIIVYNISKNTYIEIMAWEGQILRIRNWKNRSWPRISFWVECRYSQLLNRNIIYRNGRFYNFSQKWLNSCFWKPKVFIFKRFSFRCPIFRRKLNRVG